MGMAYGFIAPLEDHLRSPALGDTANLWTPQCTRLDTQAKSHTLTRVISFCAHSGLISPVPAAFRAVVDSTAFASYEVLRQEGALYITIIIKHHTAHT